MDTRQAVITRSANMCEAMLYLPQTGRVSKHSGVWTRCWKNPVEVHHMLTRSRGGLILDEKGETAHLIALCRGHHGYAHGPRGHDAGLMISGYVTTGENGDAVYLGSDQRLRHLRPVEVSAVQGDEAGPPASTGLRGRS